MSSVVVAGFPSAIPQIVMGAFDNASVGEPVPEEHRLLLQARDSMWSKDLRSSVIDAGTAAEVALGTAIHGYGDGRGKRGSAAVFTLTAKFSPARSAFRRT